MSDGQLEAHFDCAFCGRGLGCGFTGGLLAVVGATSAHGDDGGRSGATGGRRQAGRQAGRRQETGDRRETGY